MAKIDVIKYYNDSISQYKELLVTLEELDTAWKSGQIPKEQVTSFSVMVDNMQANINTLSYIVYLLNQPRFSFKRVKQDGGLLEYFKKLKIDKDSIKEFNSDVIKHLKFDLEEVNK